MTPRTLLAAVALALTVTGCTRSDPASPPPGTPTTSKAGTVQNPDTVLAKEAAQLRAVVDGLVTFSKAKGFPTGDDKTACALDQAGPWPVSWDYGWRINAGTPDSRPLARRLAERLQAQGWSVAPFGDPDADEIMLTAQKEGAGITLTAGSTGGGLAIVGTAACVNEDGSVRTAPAP